MQWLFEVIFPSSNSFMCGLFMHHLDYSFVFNENVFFQWNCWNCAPYFVCKICLQLISRHIRPWAELNQMYFYWAMQCLCSFPLPQECIVLNSNSQHANVKVLKLWNDCRAPKVWHSSASCQLPIFSPVLLLPALPLSIFCFFKFFLTPPHSSIWLFLSPFLQIPPPHQHWSLTRGNVRFLGVAAAG